MPILVQNAAKTPSSAALTLFKSPTSLSSDDVAARARLCLSGANLLISDWTAPNSARSPSRRSRAAFYSDEPRRPTVTHQFILGNRELRIEPCYTFQQPIIRFILRLRSAQILELLQKTVPETLKALLSALLPHHPYLEHPGHRMCDFRSNLVLR